MTNCSECGKQTDTVDEDGVCSECHDVIADVTARLSEDD